MGHESKRNSLSALAAGIVPILVLVGCGGGGRTPERTGVAPAEGSVLTVPARTDKPVRVVIPRGTDEVYEQIVRALDSAYSELGSPPADFDNLSEVQGVAARQLAGVAFEWPSGTSYSFFVLDDRVTVYINCDGEEKRGDWIPGGEIQQPS